MTPTLDQCRELERLYPKQWEGTEKVYAISKKESPDRPNIEGEPMLRLCAEAYADELTLLAPAPSLGEMVRVYGRAIKLVQKDGFWECTLPNDEVIEIEGETPEISAAAALIAAGGG